MHLKELERLGEMESRQSPWRRWGPFVAERAWGTVREDYSPDGRCWEYFTHDQARSKAYRWGEDGIAAICDHYEVLVFAPAFWNGQDPILKERLFGLSNPEGNHGEDVKEYYYYLDNVPSHAYMKYLYKYPQRAYPYSQLVEGNRRRNAHEPELELIDTGVFDDDRYFDIVIEYAKFGPDDIAIRIEAFNRGPDEATLHVLPHLWFRNRWAWSRPAGPEPILWEAAAPHGCLKITADDTDGPRMETIGFDYTLGARHLYGPADGALLFTNNETNMPRVYGPEAQSRSAYVKDAFHRYLVQGETEAVNPDQEGTKAAMHYALSVPALGSSVIRLRLCEDDLDRPLDGIDALVAERRQEADEFYASVHPPRASEDEKRIQRQALSNLLWSKMIYIFDVAQWMDGDDPTAPPPGSRQHGRNVHWRHLNSMRIMAVPDKWEYPWFAAWDLAFHTIALCLVDPYFAKEQLWLLLFEQFQHINGQIPAYEFEFSDLNPPVQAWALWRLYNMDRFRGGKTDRQFLERCFHKLLINFAWWVNKVDREGKNVFEGGFLGLDNITIVDRSQPLAGGAVLEQSDATGWMGCFCLSMMRIALELSHENPAYESLATKFFEHYIYVGHAMKQMGGEVSLWSETDGFFYDIVRYPDGSFERFHVRSLVGLIPLYAAERLEENWIAPFQDFTANLEWFLANRQDIVHECCYSIHRSDLEQRVHALTVVSPSQLRRILTRLWDTGEFRSRFGLRSLSKFHQDNPFRKLDAQVRYEPAESHEAVKGGNSNWRGPIWFPTTFLMIDSLRKLSKAYGPDFKIDSPDEDGEPVTLEHIAKTFAEGLIAIFARGKDGRRPVFGGNKKFQEDPHWRDHLLFYEYFHGDDGAGIGASHQTGWSALIANIIDEWRR